MKRLAVIGAGPAGAAAAMTLCASGGQRKDGVEVLLLDRSVFPRPKACAGGLSPWTLKWLEREGLGPSVRREAYPVGAARLSLGGKIVEARSGYQALILARERFDALLVEEACRRGARLVEGALVQRIVREGEEIRELQTSDGPLEVDGAILCAGANTRLAHPKRPGQVLHTIMGWYEGIDDIIDAVELYFDPGLRPHYGWLFPESPRRANVGICYLPQPGEEGARGRFEAFLARRFAHRMKGAHLLGPWRGHPIATSFWPGGLSQPGLLIAGEAAALVDPLTGEGIYHALASGSLAARLWKETLDHNQSLSPQARQRYSRQICQHLAPRLLVSQALLYLLRSPLPDLTSSLLSWNPLR